MKQLTAPALLLTVALTAAGYSGQASASDYFGPIIKMNFAQGRSPARVSIHAGAHSSPCTGFPEWYSFEDADSGLGKIWLAALLSAHASGKNVRIVGTGSCDPWGVETVSFIQLE